MVGFDLATCLLRGGDDRLSRQARLGGGQETAQPAVTERADPPEGGVRRSADPNIQRRSRFWEYLRLPHAEVVSREVDVVLPKRDAQQFQRLVEDCRALTVGHDEEVALGR